MNWKIKLFQYIVLIILFACSIYFIIDLPKQPYGEISLGIILVLFFINLIKKKVISIPIYLIGFGASIFVIYSAFTFSTFVNKQRSKFDIPTAVIFEKSNFETSLKKAKSENKYIFIDFYTGWCTPCLSFTKNVLTDEEVGKNMNDTFINLKYDAEKGEGIIIANKYNVHSYPTLLILDKNGFEVENINNSYNFIQKKKEMIEVSIKYYNRLNKN
ncbi:MAG: thioredoxin family protein [Flammeovirgaceae bacterium]|nr:thioredoxin family protein [Flammeovirgaceae bacterium]